MNISNPLHLLLIIVAALLLVALIIRLLVFLVKPSKGRDSFRLAVPFKLAGGKKRKNHVFLGVSPNAQTMASCILGEWKKEKKKKDHGLILFVDMADRFNKTAESELQEELGTSRVKLLGGTRALSHERSLSKAIGLEGLQYWLKSKRTSLYLFSGNPKENARLLSLVSGDNSIRAKVFYYSEEPSGYDDLVASTGSRIRTINPHQMAFMQLKLDRPELMPVNYVKKAGKVRGKLLLMHTINDGYFNVEDTYRMVEQLRDLGMDADIQVMPVRDESMSGNQLQPTLFNQILRFVKTNSK